MYLGFNISPQTRPIKSIRPVEPSSHNSRMPDSHPSSQAILSPLGQGDRFMGSSGEKTSLLSQGASGSNVLTFGTGETASSSRSISSKSPEPQKPDDAQLFIHLPHRKNPFTQKIHEMEDDPAFRRELKTYNGKLDDSTQAKMSKFFVGSGLGFGAYFLSSVTGSTALGIVMGAASSPFFDDMSRGLVKKWHKPPHRVQQKDLLEALETETQAGRVVQALGTDWPRLVEQSDGSTLGTVMDLGRTRRHFTNPDEIVALIGTALISRYPEQQEALKAALPKLRHSHIARQFILPALQRASMPTGYGACSVNGEGHGLDMAVQGMVSMVDAERELLGLPLDRELERSKYQAHLQQAIPKLIDYLSEE